MNVGEDGGTVGQVDAVVAQVRAADHFLLTTHQGPDGDALGSLLAMHGILKSLGKDSVMFLPASEFPLPVEYRFLPLQEVFHEAPADLGRRTVVYLDCGNADRMPVEWLAEAGGPVINIDHHHDNTFFGELNLVDPTASSTAEILFGVAEALDCELTPAIAQALYVGMVTDTGRFSYDNTTPATHRMAARLLEAGVAVGDTFSRIYERSSVEKLALLARGIGRVEIAAEGALAITYVTSSDYEQTGAGEVMTEGIIDLVRAVGGPAVAAVVRDRVDSQGPARKVSLRSAGEGVDVSQIARSHGGGGHARAAGFSTDATYEEIAAELAREVQAQL